MLHAVAQLSENALGNVGGILRDEVDAHALRTYQAYHLLNLVHHGFRRAIEEHVGLVEEENQLRQLHVAHLGQRGVEFAHQPQQEGRVELGVQHQLVGSQHTHHAFATFSLQQIENVETGLAEEALGALAFQLQQRTLDGTDGGRRDIAILGGILFGMLAHIVKHRPQVLHIEQHQIALVGDTEHDVQHSILCLVQTHQARQQLRPHLTHRGTNGMPLFAKNIVETHRTSLEFRIGDPENILALFNETAHLTCLRDATEVTLHVGHEARYTSLTKSLRQHLQRHRLAGTRGTGDESVAVGHTSTNGKRTIITVRYI